MTTPISKAAREAAAWFYNLHGHYHKHIEEACQRAIDQHEAGKWVSVKERMPKSLTCVLVYAGGNIHTDMCHNGEWYAFNGVTHWRNLPPPPQAREL